MCRTVASGSVVLVLILVLGLSIGGPALDPEFEPPTQHFDGDADDAAHVGKVFIHWVDLAVTETLTFIPSAPTRRHAPTTIIRPPQTVLEPLGSRAPPA
jgi:hypothetical protein